MILPLITSSPSTSASQRTNTTRQSTTKMSQQKHILTWILQFIVLFLQRYHLISIFHFLLVYLSRMSMFMVLHLLTLPACLTFSKKPFQSFLFQMNITYRTSKGGTIIEHKLVSEKNCSSFIFKHRFLKVKVQPSNPKEAFKKVHIRKLSFRGRGSI